MVLAEAVMATAVVAAMVVAAVAPAAAPVAPASAPVAAVGPPGERGRRRQHQAHEEADAQPRDQPAPSHVPSVRPDRGHRQVDYQHPKPYQPQPYQPTPYCHPQSGVAAT
jgi:hypothetical protein